MQKSKLLFSAVVLCDLVEGFGGKQAQWAVELPRLRVLRPVYFQSQTYRDGVSRKDRRHQGERMTDWF